MVCHTTQKEAEETICQINEGSQRHAEIYQKRYAELNEGRKNDKGKY